MIFFIKVYKFCRTPLIFRQPPLSAVANIFILPLAPLVWICICILFVVVYFTMIVQLQHPILKAMSISMLDIVTLIVGAICQQGTHLSITTTSGRIVVVTAFLATLAIFTSYSASIVGKFLEANRYAHLKFRIFSLHRTFEFANKT